MLKGTLIRAIYVQSWKFGRKSVGKPNRAIRQAIAAVQPFVQEGRFIPLADGRVREDVPYPNYVFYRQELHRIFVMNR